MGTHRLLSPEEVWRAYDSAESRLTAPVSERMLDLAGVGPGARVLDLATGRGEPALRAAQRVGPTGHVLGIDSSEAILQMAREKSAQAGLANIELRAVKAEALDAVATAADFDSATVRWGLMYMVSPVVALLNAHRALRSDGLLVAALWAEPERVPYFSLPRRLLGRYREVPRIDLEVPGTFHYANAEKISRDFAQAGFAIEHIEELEVPVLEARTDAELVAWVRALGLTRLLNELPEDTQERWERDLIEELEPSRREGWVRLGGVTRIVVARRLP